MRPPARAAGRGASSGGGDGSLSCAARSGRPSAMMAAAATSNCPQQRHLHQRHPWRSRLGRARSLLLLSGCVLGPGSNRAPALCLNPGLDRACEECDSNNRSVWVSSIRSPLIQAALGGRTQQLFTAWLTPHTRGARAGHPPADPPVFRLLHLCLAVFVSHPCALQFPCHGSLTLKRFGHAGRWLLHLQSA